MIDIWGNNHDHIQHSIDLLKKYEPPEGYYLAFSGGKDSIVCYDLCEKAGVKFDAHYMRAMEPPEIVYFIRKHYPGVIRHLPKKTMWQLIQEHGIPPLRQMRYCCHWLKELGGKGRICITGVRSAESRARKIRPEYGKHPYAKKYVLNPILAWLDVDVWDYIKNQGLPVPSLYYEGMKRVGCIMCPCGGGKQMKEQAARWPKIAEAYKRACIRAYDRKINPDWKSGEEMYDWWISGKSFSQNEGQEELEW